jgi:hypothetical protein
MLERVHSLIPFMVEHKPGMEFGMRREVGGIATILHVIAFSCCTDRDLTAKHANRSQLRGRSRRTIAIFVLATLAINTTAILILDELRPELRDPEYSRRISSLKEKLSENPQRPLVLVVGSSRTAMGVCPAKWEASRAPITSSRDFLLFNLSLIGGVPILESIVTQRAFADGIKPAAILLEYWPPLFNEERENIACASIDRMGSRDRSTLHHYHAGTDTIEQDLLSNRLNPLYASRNRLLAQLLPKWIPSHHRMDWMWHDIDGWGWKPGCDFKPGSSEPRTVLTGQARDVFKRLFAGYHLDSREDRAFRDTIELARQHNVQVSLIYMPESSEFRSWYTPSFEKAAREHFSRLTQDLGVPVIDARTWMDDGLFSDGFHLTRIGAAEFTLKLGLALAASLPSPNSHAIHH